jgi:hypothetical protein
MNIFIDHRKSHFHFMADVPGLASRDLTNSALKCVLPLSPLSKSNSIKIIYLPFSLSSPLVLHGLLLSSACSYFLLSHDNAYNLTY